jgi:hypothetical protein
MLWMLPQTALRGHEGNPECLGPEIPGRRRLAPDERLATYGGWTNQLDYALPWRLRSSSTRSAQRTLDTFQRSAPSWNFMRFEAESNGFFQRGSFLKANLLPA